MPPVAASWSSEPRFARFRRHDGYWYPELFLAVPPDVNQIQLITELGVCTFVRTPHADDNNGVAIFVGLAPEPQR